MIYLYEDNNKFYLKISDLNTKDFNKVLNKVRNFHFLYEDCFGYTSKNPKILLDCFYELCDDFEGCCSKETEIKINSFNPYVASFKPQRLKINMNYFTKWPVKGQYQIDDVIKMTQYGRIINANKQGTGKTYETVQTINQLFDKNLADRILIVVIPVMMYSWKRALLEEFSDFFVEKDFVIVTEANRDVFLNVEKLPKVVITSYNTLRLASDASWKINNPLKILKEDSKILRDYVKKNRLQNVDIEKISKKIWIEKSKNYRKCQIDFSGWGMNRVLIPDEAHKLVHLDTRWTQIFAKESVYFKYLFELSGTIAPSGIQDYYSPLKLIDNNLVDDDYTAFLHTLGEVGTDFSQYALRSIDPEKALKFQKRIKPYIIRHTLRDVIDLPPVSFKKVYLDFSDSIKQQELYRYISEEELKTIKDNNGFIRYKDVVVKFPYLMQALSDPCLLQGKIDIPILKNWKFEDSLKYKALISIIKNAFEDDKDQKIIIWEEHPNTIDRLGKSLSKFNPIIIHGSSTPKGKEKFSWRDDQIQNVFKKDKDRKILIANPATLGTGPNVQFCKTVIYFSRSFNFVDYDQSFSRVERIGMIEGVIYYVLLVDKSLDIHCDRVLENRKLLDNLFLKPSLTQEDCKNIFAGVAKVI